VYAAASCRRHGQNGFCLNWFGTQPREGIEYHLLVLGRAIASIIMGAGAVSIDGTLLMATRARAPWYVLQQFGVLRRFFHATHVTP
jgi:hypothetical protein